MINRTILPAMTFVILAGCGFQQHSTSRLEASSESCRVSSAASEFNAFELRLTNSRASLRPVADGKVLPFEVATIEAGKPLRIVLDPSGDWASTQFKTRPARNTRVIYSVDGDKDSSLILDSETMDFMAGPTLWSSSFLIPESASKSVALHLEAPLNADDAPPPTIFAYSVTARPSATLCFDNRWSAFASAALHRGGAVRLAYDTARLQNRLVGTEYNGLPTWSILAHMAIHREGRADPDFVSLPVKLPQTSVLMPILRIPDDAMEVEFWFEGTSRAGSVYDSDFDRNFSFPVVR